MTNPTDPAAYEWTGVDDDLPGMWSHSDFLGGDPDERSYAQRERDAAADAVSLGRIAPCRAYDRDEPIGYDGFGAPLYAHQIAPEGQE
jgi:hypothetical protein